MFLRALLLKNRSKLFPRDFNCSLHRSSGLGMKTWTRKWSLRVLLVNQWSLGHFSRKVTGKLKFYWSLGQFFLFLVVFGSPWVLYFFLFSVPSTKFYFSEFTFGNMVFGSSCTFSSCSWSRFSPIHNSSYCYIHKFKPKLNVIIRFHLIVKRLKMAFILKKMI